MPPKYGSGISTVARRSAVSNDPALLFPRRGKDTRRASHRFPSSHLPPQKGLLAPRRGIGSFFKKAGKKAGKIAKKVAKPVHKATHAMSKLGESVLSDVKDPRVRGALQALKTVDSVSGGIAKAGGGKKMLKQAGKAAGRKALKAGKRVASGKSSIREEATNVKRAARRKVGFGVNRR